MINSGRKKNQAEIEDYFCYNFPHISAVSRNFFFELFFLAVMGPILEHPVWNCADVSEQTLQLDMDCISLPVLFLALYV